MQLAYQYCYRDYVALCEARYRAGWLGPHYLKIQLVALVVLGVILAYDILWLEPSESVGFWVMIAVAGLAGGLGTALFLRPVIHRLYYRRQGLDKKPIELTVSDEGVKVAAPKVNSDMAWSAFVRADRYGGTRFLWINKVQAVSFPERSFADEQQLRTFEALVESRMGDKV